jgi:hypothetical protein
MADPTPPPPGPPPAGWYADPYGGGARRWWDGERWSENVAFQQPWRDPRPLVPFVITGLVLTAIAAVGLLAALKGRLDVADALRTDGIRAYARAVRSDNDVRTASVLQLVAFAGTAVVWLVWFARAYHDAALMRRVRHPGLAVWGWLIPFVSLVVPKRMMNDAWLAGDPDFDKYTMTPSGISRVVGLWWLAYLGGGVLAFVAQVAAKGSSPARTVDDLTAGTRVAMAATVLQILAAVCAVAVVRDVTRRLDARGRAEGRL